MAYRESYAGKINRKLNKKLHVVEVASGRQKADLVLKNATYVNVFCNELSHGDIAVAEGLIAGMGEHYEGAVEVDMGGKLVLPGFVDAHIHRHHRPARDRQCHGHRRHRVYAAGDGRSAR